jgi:hypothetical protein
MASPEELAASLRKWAATQDNSDKAAVELLCWHEGWLLRADFRAACVAKVSGYTVIRWRMAREFAEAGPRCSTAERNVLGLAVALALDDFGLSGFGHAHRRAAAQAFAAAAGLRLEPPVPEAGHSHPDFIPGDPATCHRCALEARDEGRSLPGGWNEAGRG